MNKRHHQGKPSIRLIVLMLLSAATWVTAAMVEFDVQPQVLRVGEAGRATFTIRGLNNPPTPPVTAIQGLEIYQPQVGQRSNINRVNGKSIKDSYVTYTYRFVPQQPGKFSFGPYNYKTNQGVIAIPAKEIEVIANNTTRKTADSGEAQAPVFAELMVLSDPVYEQQQFYLQMSIYSRSSVSIDRSIEVSNMPETGFSISRDMETLAPGREVLNNEVYDIRRYRVAVQALTAGQFKIQPKIKLYVVKARKQSRRRSPFDDPFFGGGIFGSAMREPLELSTDVLELNIKPLPEEGRPEGFSGAVGTFRFDAQVTPRKVAVGEPLNLKMSILGQGNIEQAMPPPFPNDKDFKIYEAQRLESGTEPGGIGKKTYEQVIIPMHADITELPAVAFSFFNPSEQRYKTIKRGPFPIVLDAASEPTPAPVIAGTVTADLPKKEIEVDKDIIFLVDAPEQWKKTSTALYKNRTFLATQLIPLFILFTVLAIKIRRESLNGNVAKARRSKALRSAEQGFKQAEKALHDKNADAFYDGLWMALANYFGNRLNLAPGEVAHETVTNACCNSTASKQLLEATEQLFTACDHHRFGGGVTAIDDLRQLLTDARKTAKSFERIKL